MSDRRITLHGRIFLRANIELLTGLHIGGAAGGLEIGGVDKPVIRNARTNQPYIPGSSLKGKMRSLTEKALGAPQTFRVNSNVFVHMPESADEYKRFRAIAGVFGTLPERNRFVISTPTRLAVRDVQLTPESREELKKMRADLPFTEIKWEAAIDRVTSAAAPRQIERVPAGAVFGPAELVFSVYTGDDETAGEVAELFLHVVNALGHLEDDYLGGMGSRGNGQVKLKQISISARLVQGPTYADEKHFGDALDDLRAIDHDKLKDWLTETFVG